MMILPTITADYTTLLKQASDIIKEYFNKIVKFLDK